jgi:hypothetical protein
MFTRFVFLNDQYDEIETSFSGSKLQSRNGFVYQTFTGPNSLEQCYAYSPVPLRSPSLWWINNFPYGLYSNCLNGYTFIDMCPNTMNNYDLFFSGDTDAWVPGAYPIISRSTAGNPQLINDYSNSKFQLMEVVIVPISPSIKIRTTIRAKQKNSGSSSGSQPDFNMGWEDSPYMCINVKVEWLPLYARIVPNVLQNAASYTLNFNSDAYNPVVAETYYGAPIVINDMNIPYIPTENRLFTIDDFD